ncbi:GNAT family N-acetyltransferase [Microcella alkaliphila]|uniref:GNAT family N-acetyltransferase n=1 Tax=Microcella alkaliphila TaxID=279828 RepID=UPI000BBA50F8
MRSSHRHRGIGRGLVRLLLDHGAARNIAQFTVDANESALQFYAHLGFSANSLKLERTIPTQ